MAAPCGEANGNSRLSRDDVLTILIRVGAGESYQSVAETFGITKVQVHNIARGSAQHCTREAMAVVGECGERRRTTR
jgi:hypothetical protein